ncbi:hypothetical protein GBA52_028401 [Prunus armeniaca]|nr:hypothetical protein GBA52_028401 [Prunus armeniaca]
MAWPRGSKPPSSNHVAGLQTKTPIPALPLITSQKAELEIWRHPSQPPPIYSNLQTLKHGVRAKPARDSARPTGLLRRAEPVEPPCAFAPVRCARPRPWLPRQPTSRRLKTAYIFVVDVPGLKPDMVNVQVEDDNVLVVSRGEEERKGEGSGD